jgi:hypothetical protein
MSNQLSGMRTSLIETRRRPIRLSHNQLALHVCVIFHKPDDCSSCSSVIITSYNIRISNSVKLVEEMISQEIVNEYFAFFQSGRLEKRVGSRILGE